MNILRTQLTRRVVRLEDKGSRSAVLLVTSVEDELVSWHAHIAHSASHVVCRTVDNKVTEQCLALPEGAVESVGWVELV